MNGMPFTAACQSGDQAPPISIEEGKSQICDKGSSGPCALACLPRQLQALQPEPAVLKKVGEVATRYAAPGWTRSSPNFL